MKIDGEDFGKAVKTLFRMPQKAISENDKKIKQKKIQHKKRHDKMITRNPGKENNK